MPKEMTEEEMTKSFRTEAFNDGERTYAQNVKDPEPAATEGTTTTEPAAEPDEPEEVTDDEVAAAVDGDETGDDVRDAAKKLAQKMASGRIGKLTQMKHANTRRIAELEAQLAAKTVATPTAPIPVDQQGEIERRAAALVSAQPDAAKAPDPAKYDMGQFDDKYIADMVDYRMDQKERLTNAKKQVTADVLKASSGSSLNDAEKAKLANALKTGTKPAADYDKVVLEGANKGEWKLSADMGRCIADSEHGMAVAYQLAKNPTLADEIYSLPVHQQVLRFGKIEAEVAAKGPPPVKTTSAPTPITTTRGSGSSAPTSAPTDTEDFDELEKWYKSSKSK